MSWDAYLHDDRGHLEGSWNYTHNCNRMIGAAVLASEGTHTPTTAALSEDHIVARLIGPAWFERLDKMGGEESVRYLQMIISELESHPSHYRTFDPPNGWGGYDTLLPVLRQMRDSVPTGWPSEWSVTG